MYSIVKLYHFNYIYKYINFIKIKKYFNSYYKILLNKGRML